MKKRRTMMITPDVEASRDVDLGLELLTAKHPITGKQTYMLVLVVGDESKGEAERYMLVEEDLHPEDAKRQISRMESVFKGVEREVNYLRTGGPQYYRSLEDAAKESHRAILGLDAVLAARDAAGLAPSDDPEDLLKEIAKLAVQTAKNARELARAAEEAEAEGNVPYGGHDDN